MGQIKKGRVILVSCKRCDRLMFKWQRFPIELDVTHPFPFDRVCGRCLTQQEVDFYYNRNGNVRVLAASARAKVYSRLQQ